MRSLLIAAVALTASTASAQNMWQMNAAYQNQINTAQASAWAPYYAPRPYYGRPVYAPIYGGYYGDDTAWEIRQLNNTLQSIEGNRRLDAIRRRPWIR